MKRLDCFRQLAGLLDELDLVVGALGGTWSEWDSVRPSDANFFNSAMGSNLPLALGLSLALPHRRVILLDTDGCLLMTLGALCTLGNEQPRNLRVFVFDNRAYLSTGGQATATRGKTDIAGIAQAAGIEGAASVEDLTVFQSACQSALRSDKLSFLVARVEAERAPVPKPSGDHIENKYQFMRHIETSEGQRHST